VNPGALRASIAEDATIGNRLLVDKYNWIKGYIFRGIEFDGHNLVRLP
jgi:hypothetical protein